MIECLQEDSSGGAELFVLEAVAAHQCLLVVTRQLSFLSAPMYVPYDTLLF